MGVPARRRGHFAERFGDVAAAQAADRYEKAVSGIPVTLAAIKRAAESLLAQPAS